LSSWINKGDYYYYYYPGIMFGVVTLSLSDLQFTGATTIGTGGDWSPLSRWWTNNVLVPQLLGRSFQKARNFTASSHQNAGFSILGPDFQKILGKT